MLCLTSLNGLGRCTRYQHLLCTCVQCCGGCQKGLLGAQAMLEAFVDFIVESKTVMLEELAAEFGLRVQVSQPLVAKQFATEIETPVWMSKYTLQATACILAFLLSR